MRSLIETNTEIIYEDEEEKNQEWKIKISRDMLLLIFAGIEEENKVKFRAIHS